MENKNEATVWFRCDNKNTILFHLNTQRKLTHIPVIGDIITRAWDEDYLSVSWKIRYKKQKYNLDCPVLVFIVKSRSFDISLNEWELICEPTPKSLIYAMSMIKKTN